MAKAPTRAFREFIESEAAGGLILMASAALALVIANSPLAGAYFAAIAFNVGRLSVGHWINDALMAVFFLLVGLEIKRELAVGQLATWPARALPGFAALGHDRAGGHLRCSQRGFACEPSRVGDPRGD